MVLLSNQWGTLHRYPHHTYRKQRKRLHYAISASVYFFLSHLGITSEMVEATLAGDHRLVLPLEKEHFFLRRRVDIIER